MTGMVDVAALRAAYYAQMAIPPGLIQAQATAEHDGPLLRLVGGPEGRIRGPRDLGVTGAELDRLIARQRDYFEARGEGLEWKVRAHDLPIELPERLRAAGFEPRYPAAVLIGKAEEVATEPEVPDGIVLRRATAPEDMRRIADQQSEVWGLDLSWVAADLTARLEADPTQVDIVLAEAADRVVCTAWSVHQPGTEFVALLGGSTVEEWRGRGIYRATIAARAQAAVARGVRLLHVDASPDSAPILRRCGFHEVTTAVQYCWAPPATAGGPPPATPPPAR